MAHKNQKSNLLFLYLTLIGFIKAVKPRTRPILEMLDPITLPIAIPLSPLIFAIILTTISGRLVPNAMIVMQVLNARLSITLHHGAVP